VGGGAPIFSRAAAFTAVDALNGLGLRGFDGMIVPPGGNKLNLSSTARDDNSAAIAKKISPPRCRGAGLHGGSRKGLSEEQTQYE
jgi:hypothetical protein